MLQISRVVQSSPMNAMTGTMESGAVRLERPVGWADGQRVLVIALPADEALGLEAPPLELLEEDARELGPRRDALANVNRDEL